LVILTKEEVKDAGRTKRGGGTAIIEVRHYSLRKRERKKVRRKKEENPPQPKKKVLNECIRKEGCGSVRGRSLGTCILEGRKKGKKGEG